MDLKEELRVTDAWSLKGELTLSCNCEVFCPACCRSARARRPKAIA